MSSIALDPTSTRVLSGSRDYTLRMYDFGGMKSDMKAFRTLTPCDGHPVLATCWSTTGTHALLIRMPYTAPVRPVCRQSVSAAPCCQIGTRDALCREFLDDRGRG